MNDALRVRGGASGEIRSSRCLTKKAFSFPRSKASFTEFLPPLVRTFAISLGKGKKPKKRLSQSISWDSFFEFFQDRSSALGAYCSIVAKKQE
ncbi:hypothetical protein [Saccharibacillus endophyticus]|uniref:hypothetical protein n=1 Tax=Saccharibacillus endophyticus TaxID=2060666 RepID=UPI001555CC29|nr:hypothetical protein [Saccharibacillus endophyticus]